MAAQHIVDLFGQVAAAIGHEIAKVDDWGPSGIREGQYTIDVAADAVAVKMLREEGLGVLSEESGETGIGREIVVVVDPIDGSTNAAAGLPWFATSLCAVDKHGPLAAMVVNQATKDCWHAVRDEGAVRNGTSIGPSATRHLRDALVAVSGLPATHLGWRQFRCYGAAALDICSVADGTFDAFVDVSVDAHGSWDYLGAMLVLEEAGGVVRDRHGRELTTLSHQDRRTPIAAANQSLLSEIFVSKGD